MTRTARVEARPDVDAAAMAAELRGWRVSVPPALGRALVRHGGRPGRHLHVLVRDLLADPAPAPWRDPPLAPGQRFAPADRPAADLLDAFAAAFGPAHPDRAQIGDAEAELGAILAGRAFGPLLDCSGLVVRADGSVAAAVLVTYADDPPPVRGPWMPQLFRHPDAPGAGTALLRRALGLATRAALPSLGLVVSHGNLSARALYAAHGFAERLEAITVDL